MKVECNKSYQFVIITLDLIIEIIENTYIYISTYNILNYT
jgi:hypothetical protein